MTNEEIRAAAIEFAKRHKNEIAKELTNPAKFLPDEFAISAFMAGSPGAGKTEFSKYLITILEATEQRRVIRIDGDEVRQNIPGYTGNNSHLFQGAISLIVEKVHDYALHQKQTFVLDGTFAKYEKAVENISRSLKKGRLIFIFYVYQKPEIAWKFTLTREKEEGRNIPKSAFIEQFLGAKESIQRISKEFGNKVIIYFVKKNFETNAVEDIVNMGYTNTQIDDYIKEHYTKEILEKLL